MWFTVLTQETKTHKHKINIMYHSRGFFTNVDTSPVKPYVSPYPIFHLLCFFLVDLIAQEYSSLSYQFAYLTLTQKGTDSLSHG